jgi:hypothetical protein
LSAPTWQSSRPSNSELRPRPPVSGFSFQLSAFLLLPSVRSGAHAA